MYLMLLLGRKLISRVKRYDAAYPLEIKYGIAIHSCIVIQ